LSDPIRDDFRNFLFIVWEHLGLPEPTPAQYEIAYFLQHGFPSAMTEKGRRDIIEGYRGVGKSYITAAYVLWRLYRDPVNEKILVTSASSVKSKEFVAQAKGILMTLPLLAHLRPGKDQRDMADRFDVKGASNSQSPSVKAAGITGQITGSRATCIIPDDIEVPDNSVTEEARSRLMGLTNEFEAIILPGGDIIYLGTPQTEESIYNKKIKEQGYNCFAVPARYPTADNRKSCVLQRTDGTLVDIIAPFLRDQLEANPDLAGAPTDPRRFDNEELIRRESKGRSFFALQYQLDTSLSDAEKYPLRASDLIVMSVNTAKAPITIQWGKHTDGKNIVKGIPNYGVLGDYCLGPLFMDNEWREYTGSVMFIDPSGRGADETAWTVLKVLNGIFFAPTIGGHKGDVTEAQLKAAMAAKAHNVNLILIEPNFAPGVWINSFFPVLQRIWPGGCTVEEADWAKGQKERRIIDTLEPLLNSHRLVVDDSIVKDETFMYQLTHITKERGALRHDDRLDSLAGAVSHFERVLALDMTTQADQLRDDEFQQEIDDFLEYATSPNFKGYSRARRNGRVVKDAEVYRVNI